MMKISAVVVFLLMMISGAEAKSITILALGDSLTAGYGLAPAEAFPVKLEAALKASGQDVVVVNAGVSGDTALDGASRLDWALSDDIDAVIVELGANDALRGLPPQQAEQAIDDVLARLKAKGLPVLLAGMRAPPNLGPEYQASFDGMYQRLAEKHGALLYPFFLDGVAADVKLNQADGLHPNPAGVDIVVARMLPAVLQLIGSVGKK